jgi:uncharacterized protein (DUF1810 family)
MMGEERYDLGRFVRAQDSVYERVCQELRGGQKTSHWMWFVFPQLRGLGQSQMARTFGIAERGEAEAYLKHPVLGSRLRECTGLVEQVQGRSIVQIFGYPDDLKFRSSMTLFAAVAPGEQIFQDALDKYFGGEPDARTLELLSTS